MAHDDPGDRGPRRAAPHTPETAELERLRSWACLDADSVPHDRPNFYDTVVVVAYSRTRPSSTRSVSASSSQVILKKLSAAQSWTDYERISRTSDTSSNGSSATELFSSLWTFVTRPAVSGRSRRRVRLQLSPCL